MSWSLPEGFTVRSATMDDADAVNELIVAADTAVQGWSDSTIADVREWWRRDWGEPDRRLVEGDGLAAYAEVFDHGELAELDGYVHPSSKGRGLGAWMIAAAEERARRRGKARIQAWCLAPDVDGRSLFELAGFLEARRFYRMLIELDQAPPEPDWPEGLQVETFRDEDARTFYDTLQDAFAEEWNFVPEPFERWLEFRLEAPDFDPTLWFLVRDGEEVAAVLRCDRRRFDAGWIGAIGVRKPWRKRGLGLALLLHGFGDFHRRGERKVALGVDAQNPTGATRLYERAGMHVAYEAIAFAKEIPTEVAP